MNYLGRLMNATGSAITAFRETMSSADPARGRAMFSGAYDDWSRWQGRNERYDKNWRMYENTAYRELVYRGARLLKTAYGTTKHIRPIYNPASRLVDFYSNHVWGGRLDPLAGDGEAEQSALPILTEVEALRPAIAQLWRDSTWQVNKDVATLWGAGLGDVGIRVVDDPERGKVRKELVHPSHLVEVDFDDQHNVKGYLLRKWVEDPDAPRKWGDPETGGRSVCQTVEYAERCYRDGEKVIYETFKQNRPYGWGGKPPVWEEKYGFVPLVVVPHRSIGLDWGAYCFYGSDIQFIEVDDQASCLGDNNRKKLNGPWLVAGVKGTSELKVPGADRSQRTGRENAGDPEPGRTEMNFIYATDPAANAISLTADMDITGMCEHIGDLIGCIEKKYPELLADVGMTGTVTAEAVRKSRQVASSRVQSVRPAYDAAEVATNQMALAIGGFRGYPGYEGFNLDSFAAGSLDHAIAHRPVFEVDPLDSLGEEAAFLANVGAATKAGIPLAFYLEENGWPEEKIARLEKAKAAEPPPVVVAPMPGKPPIGGAA